MIKITCGTCRTSAGIKTSKDGFFELPCEEEARLVRRNVAEYARVPVTERVPPVATLAEPDVDCEPCANMGSEESPAEGLETACLDVGQLQEMTVSDLKRLAEDMGIDTAKLRKKAQLIAAIADVPIETAIEEGGSDVPPSLEVGAPVV